MDNECFGFVEWVMNLECWIISFALSIVGRLIYWHDEPGHSNSVFKKHPFESHRIIVSAVYSFAVGVDYKLLFLGVYFGVVSGWITIGGLSAGGLATCGWVAEWLTVPLWAVGWLSVSWVADERSVPLWPVLGRPAAGWCTAGVLVFSVCGLLMSFAGCIVLISWCDSSSNSVFVLSSFWSCLVLSASSLFDVGMEYACIRAVS